jgi:hypothetical protein
MFEAEDNPALWLSGADHLSSRPPFCKLIASFKPARRWWLAGAFAAISYPSCRRTYRGLQGRERWHMVLYQIIPFQITMRANLSGGSQNRWS